MISSITIEKGFGRRPGPPTIQVSYITPGGGGMNGYRHGSKRRNVVTVRQNQSDMIGTRTSKFTEMGRLHEGWDGYKASVPSSRALLTAQNFLVSLVSRGVEPSRIAPSVVGGVGLTRRQGPRKVYVEFLNDGRVFALFSDGVSDPRTRQVNPGYQDFRKLIGEMKDYLDG